jgi:peptidoglycan-N-acetylglucosamine deacetylase
LRVVRRLGLEPIMWSVSSRDWALPSAQAIEQQVSPRLRGGDVVLMHDGSHRGFGWDRSKTVAATDAVIRRGKQEGYCFCAVGEMLEIS